MDVSGNNAIVNLWPLRVFKRLDVLACNKCSVHDISQIHGLRLASLSCAFTDVGDLRSLSDMQPTHLQLTGTPVFDISPLAKMPLRKLEISSTNVSDLTPLQGKRIRELGIRRCPLAHPEQLADIRVTDLWVDVPMFDDRWSPASLAGVTSVWEDNSQRLNVDQYIEKLARRRSEVETFVEKCSDLSLVDRIEAVRNEVARRASNRDATKHFGLEITLRDGSELELTGFDFSPLIALPEIQSITVNDYYENVDFSWMRKLQLSSVYASDLALLEQAFLWSEMDWSHNATINDRPAREELERVIDKLENPTKYLAKHIAVSKMLAAKGGWFWRKGKKVDGDSYRNLEQVEIKFEDAVLSTEDIASISELRSVYALSFTRTDLSDEQMKRISGLSGMQMIACRTDALSGEGVKQLAKFPYLNRLFLDGVGDINEQVLWDLPVFKKADRLGLATPWITDATLERLTDHPHLTELNLISSYISNDGLKLLGAESKLESLKIYNTSITNDGLINLHKIPRLKSIEAFGLTIDDAGRAHLAKIKTLKTLDVRFIGRITAEGVAALQEKLPDCEVLWDGKD